VVQLGANVGKSHSDMVWALFEERPGLSGLFVEPHPASFKKLKEYYSQYQNCFFEQVAIVTPKLQAKHADSGTIPLYYRANRPSHNSHEQASVLNTKTTSVEVPYLELYPLLEKYNLIGVEFELLQIDIEGLDLPLLQGVDFEKILPRYIRAETVHHGNFSVDDTTNHLAQWGYEPLKFQDDPYYNIYERKFYEFWDNSTPEPANFNTVWERKE
jgi:FkbM family methyltransferase